MRKVQGASRVARWCLAAALAAAPLAAWPGRAPAADAKQVEALVRELGSADVAVRDRAEAQLLALGPDALAHLPAPENRELSVEQRGRLQKVVAKLNRTKLEGLLKESTVTLPSKPMPLDALLAEMTRQTGNGFKDMRGDLGQEADNPTLTFAGEKLPFWAALDKVCAAGKVEVYHFGQDRQIGIRAAGGAPAYARDGEAAAGAFRFRLQQVALERDAAMGTSSCTLSLEAIFEPRLRPVQIDFEDADIVAKDDKGRAVETAREGSHSLGVGEGGYQVPMILKFKAPPRDAQRLATVSGELSVTLPARVETMTFKDWSAAAPAPIERGGLKMTVRDAKDEGDGLWSVRLVVEKPAEAQGESHQLAALEPEVFLENREGSRFTANGGKNKAEGDNSVELEYVFTGVEGKLADHVFVARVPVGLTKFPVKFTLKDVQLP